MKIFNLFSIFWIFNTFSFEREGHTFKEYDLHLRSGAQTNGK